MARKIQVVARLYWYLGVMILVSCSQPTQEGGLTGYLQDFTVQELLAYQGRLAPVPEYAPSRGVVVSYRAVVDYQLTPLIEHFAQADLEEIVVVVDHDNQFDAMTELQHLPNLRLFTITDNRYFADSAYDWVRDWVPLSASYQGDHAAEQRLLGFNYYSMRDLANNAKGYFAQTLQTPLVSIPIQTEGGNFMNNHRGDCIMTEGVYWREKSLVQNLNRTQQQLQNLLSNSNLPRVRRELLESHLVAVESVLAQNPRSFSREQVDQIFRRYLGCRRVISLPPSPADRNEHIDMFAKFLNDETILVHQLNEETIAVATNQPETTPYHQEYLDFLERVKQHLEASAATLEAAGFKVVRVPLPLPYAYDTRGQQPVNQRNSAQSMPTSEAATVSLFSAGNRQVNLVMRSYVNSLILNGDVYVPRYRAPTPLDDQRQSFPSVIGMSKAVPGSQYPDAELLRVYERRVEAAYRAAGLNPIWIDSDLTIYSNGSIHCLTMQVARGVSN